MRFGNDRLPYEIAMNVFEQGMECDAAARIIRRELPAFLKSVADRVKQDFNNRAIEEWGYNEQKEALWLRHYTHGKGTEQAGPNDPDCPCRGTEQERECAYYGRCGFCEASVRQRDQDDPGDKQ